MSDDFVNRVTIDCLMNKEQYNKYITSKEIKSTNRKDKKFYRQRIYSLIKELLLSKEEKNHILPDVIYTFDNFVNSCIHYFKTLDHNDIVQADYINLENSCNIGNNIPELNIDDLNNKEEADKLLLRSIKVSNSSLDTFIKRTFIKKSEEIIYPKKKEINLKDPELKNKGILNLNKKKNITNKYDETDNSKKEEEKK